jgi:hypothetical protein
MLAVQNTLQSTVLYNCSVVVMINLYTLTVHFAILYTCELIIVNAIQDFGEDNSICEFAVQLSPIYHLFLRKSTKY